MPQVPTYSELTVKPTALPGLDSPNIYQGQFGEGIARSLRGLGGQVNQVAQQEILDADRVAIMEADTMLGDWENGALFHPEFGAFNRKGQAAFDLVKQVGPAFDAEANRIGATMKTPRQQMAYGELRNSRRVAITRKLEEHETGQRQVYYNDQAASSLTVSIRAAGNYFNDPAIIKKELGRQRIVLTEQARRNQWPAAQLDEALRSSTSKTHMEVIDRMLALKRTPMARSYFESVRDQMLGDDATKVERALQTDDASSRAMFRDQLQNVEAAARLGIPVDNVPSRESLMAAFGDYEGSQLHNEALKWSSASRVIGDLHHRSATRIGATVAQAIPTEVEGAYGGAQRAAVIEQQAREILIAREKDPAGYMMTHTPELVEVWERMSQDPTAVGQYMGLLEEKRFDLQIQSDKVLPEAYADQVIQQITKPTTHGDLYTAVTQEARRWGEKYWPRVLAQIESKVPDSVSIIAAVSPATGVALSAMSGLKTSELEALVPSTQTMKSVQDAVLTRMAPFMGTFPPDTAGARKRAALFDSAVRLSLYHASQGSSLSSAIDIAQKSLASSMYNVREYRGVPFRIPVSQDYRAVEQGARLALTGLRGAPTERDLATLRSRMTAEELAGYIPEWIQQHGYWMTMPSDAGLRLYVDGAPVTLQRGMIQYTWEELAGMAQGRRAQVKALADQYRREDQ